MEQADAPRVWMKAAVFERQQRNRNKALELCTTAVERFPDYAKNWLILGQMHSAQNPDKARSVYKEATKKCPAYIPLWIHYAHLEERANQSVARSVLEKARSANPRNAALWLESLRFETRAGNAALAKSLLAKALQECPLSGALLAESICTEQRHARKSKSADAFKKTENDPHVMAAIARFFWSERKSDKARSWFEKAAKADPDLGDVYVYWLAFELACGTPEQRELVVTRATEAEPRHGMLWQPVLKDDDKRKWSVQERLEFLAKDVTGL
jgi:pre-mRNA-processing factor 6